MRSYRLVLVLKSGLTKEKKKKLLDQIDGWAGAKDSKSTDLGEKKLMYPIKRERKGEYVAMEFQSEKISTDFEKRLIISDDILRHLMIRTK
ncbi:MAG: 30S ribosomal protein S6 [Candidatus Levyibacteriota bacterium]